MESLARPQATLADLLDRVLDRGLVINADIVVTLAGVPLIGINLRAALAGMETMTRYGLLREWDQSIRAEALARGTPERTPMAAEQAPAAARAHGAGTRPDVPGARGRLCHER